MAKKKKRANHLAKLFGMYNRPAQIAAEYETLRGEKSVVISKTETYSSWTLPTVFPADDTNDEETQHDYQSIGARSVNHLANKLAFTLFAPARSFFRLEPTTEYLAELEGKGLDTIQVHSLLAKAETIAMRRFVTWRSRTAAIFALKSIIITGNSLMYFQKEGRAQVYNFRDYVVKRDLSGHVLDIITVDKKKVATLPEEIRQLVLKHPTKSKKDEDNCDLYTRIRWHAGNKKYYVFQAVDDVVVEDVVGIYAKNELPWIPLTWDLQRGKDYGTGLVEEYAGDFHALSTLTSSIVVGATIAADIKFLVDPTGNTDYNMLNSATSGSYIPGRKEDIEPFSLEGKMNDWNFVNTLITQYEKRIGLAFLLGSAITRDAERVTAEEIRHQAQELETGLGGQYSRLAEEFQLPMSYILLKDIDFSIDGADNNIEPIIVTGLESLSRNSEVEKLLLFLQDMAMVSQLPDEVKIYIDVPAIMSIFGTARSVDYQSFTKTQEQVNTELQQRQAQALELQRASGQNDAVNQATASKLAE